MSGSSIRISDVIGESVSPPPASHITLEYQHSLLRMWLVLTDIVALGAALAVAYWLRFDIQLTVSPEGGSAT